MKAIPVLAVAALLLTGCGAMVPAPTQAPTAPTSAAHNDSPQGAAVSQKPAAPSAHKVGEKVLVDGGKSKSNITIVSADYSAAPLSQFDAGPGKGGYLILDVLWETVEGTADVNPLLFNAKDAAGVQQTVRLGVTGVDTLKAVNVPAGDKLRGKLVYDIAAGPWTVTVGAFTEAARWSVG